MHTNLSYLIDKTLPLKLGDLRPGGYLNQRGKVMSNYKNDHRELP